METLGVLDIPLWLLLIVLACVLLYVYGTWPHSTWVSQAVPGPKPWPLVGNLPEVFEKTQFRVFGDWQQRYGDVVGYYSGVRPTLSLTDLEMLKEVMVKQFSNFVDRNLAKGMRPPTIDKGLFFATGTTWKRIRNMMTPAFSSSKLKLMSHYINRCSVLLTQSIENKAKANELIDVKDLYGSFTMDVIAGTAFGLETNSQTETGEPFVQHSRKLFELLTGGALLRPIILFVTAFPMMGPVLGKLGLSFLNSEHSQFFIKAVHQMIDDRHQSDGQSQSRKASDLLQMLVEAEADEDDITDIASSGDGNKSHRRMTKEEMVGQGFIVLIAGYETTATTLQYLTYNLTLNPHVQELLVQEIRDKLGDADPTYENVSTLKYLDAAIHETLRLFPPVPVVNRQSVNKVMVKGITIPAGCGITIPIHTIMHDPRHFPDPDTFRPERFLDDNRASVDNFVMELSFGHGPRQCIGMRLALLEIKFAAVRVLRQFRFVKCAETPDKIVLGKSFALAVPDKTIKVKAEVRDT